MEILYLHKQKGEFERRRFEIINKKKKKSKHAPFSLCTVCYDCICLFYDTVLNYGLDFVLDWFHDVHSHCVHKTVINGQT